MDVEQEDEVKNRQREVLEKVDKGEISLGLRGLYSSPITTKPAPRQSVTSTQTPVTDWRGAGRGLVLTYSHQSSYNLNPRLYPMTL